MTKPERSLLHRFVLFRFKLLIGGTRPFQASSALAAAVRLTLSIAPNNELDDGKHPRARRSFPSSWRWTRNPHWCCKDRWCCYLIRNF